MTKSEKIERDGVRGWLHPAGGEAWGSLGLTHGAGSNCSAPLLVAVAEEFARRGLAVLRYDLPFRQERPSGSPTRAQEKDRDGVRQVARLLREFERPVYLGGHSYGGRQTSMAAAEDSGLAKALLLLGYPLHPPKQPEKPRTEHFPSLQVPTVFIHGVKDEFASVLELDTARRLIPVRTDVDHIEQTGHGLHVKFASRIVERFVTFTKE